MTRAELIRRIEEGIGHRQLVWFGTRGDDVESATQIGQLASTFSLINTYDRRSNLTSLSLEDLTATRPDLDTFDLDAHPRDAAVIELRQAVLRAVARPSVLFTYRPSDFLSAISFARSDSCRYLGMFSGHQVAFEHKPWVESAVASLDIPHIPWTYVADADRLEALPLLRKGPVVLRRSRTTGGVGLVRLTDPTELDLLWPDEDEAFVSVAPFLADTVPVNVAAVVWRDRVTMHPASIQLIGIPSCTTRRFGYCGNDFAAVIQLGRLVLDSIEVSIRRIGDWLRSHGYLGAFGADFMVQDGIAMFTEVNPRFQGSTHLSCEISVELDLPCLLTEHLAACLGLPAPDSLSLWQWAEAAPPRSHVVLHSLADQDQRVDPGQVVDRVRDTDLLIRADVLTRPDLLTAPGGALGRLTLRDSITKTGFELTEPIAAALSESAQLRC